MKTVSILNAVSYGCTTGIKNLGFKNYALYVFLLSVVAIIKAILSLPQTFTVKFFEQPPVTTVNYPTYWFANPLYMLLVIMISVFITNRALGNTQVSISAYLRAVLAELAVLVLFMIGFIFLIIPGFYWLARYFFVSTLMLDKNSSMRDAFKQSAAMTHGVKWELFLVLAGWSFIYRLLQAVASSMFVMSSLTNDVKALAAYVPMFINLYVDINWAFFVPMIVVTSVHLYRQIQEQNSMSL